MYDMVEESRIQRFPKQTRYRLNYDKMQVGDVWGTVCQAPIAIGIKVRTWGLRHALSLEKCSHMAIVVRIESQFFLVEAIGGGVVISTCHKYLNPGPGNLLKQVCWIGRHTKMEPGNIEWLNTQLLRLAFDSPNYDTGGAAHFAIPFLRHSPMKLFCSELVDTAFTAADKDLAILPKKSPWQIVPADYQRSTLMRDLTAETIRR